MKKQTKKRGRRYIKTSFYYTWYLQNIVFIKVKMAKRSKKQRKQQLDAGHTWAPSNSNYQYDKTLYETSLTNNFAKEEYKESNDHIYTMQQWFCS